MNFLNIGRLERIRASHRGRPIGSVTIRWEVGLNE